MFNALLRLWKDGSKRKAKHVWVSGIAFNEKEEEEHGTSTNRSDYL